MPPERDVAGRKAWLREKWEDRQSREAEKFREKFLAEQFQSQKLDMELRSEKIQAQKLSSEVAKLTRAQVEEIAKTKMKDLTAADLDAAVRTIAGSARSMGVIVEGV